MSFEPEKFFVGLVDFFSVLLPGAVLTYLVHDTAGPRILGDRYFDLQGTESWMAFLVASYLLGHFLFLIGSLLDDHVYDPIRKTTDDVQISRLLEGRDLSPRLARILCRWSFKAHPNVAREGVVQIKEAYLKRVGSPDAVNAFQWCKARLALQHPKALAIVNRFEADSKFFRSFVPVLLGVLAVALYHQKWGLAGAVTVFLGFAFLRYMEQRFKATQQAYWFLLTLEARRAARAPCAARRGPRRPRKRKPGARTHAGGVVFRKKGWAVEYLLVQAKRDPQAWVLPKGHIEPNEDRARTAIREVREEAGVWARIVQELGDFEHSVNDKIIKVCFYLMEAIERGSPEERSRKHVWLPVDDAVRRATHKESQHLLRIAEARRTMIEINERLRLVGMDKTMIRVGKA